MTTVFWFTVWLAWTIGVATAARLGPFDFGQVVMFTVLAVLMGSVVLIPMDRVHRQEAARRLHS